MKIKITDVREFEDFVEVWGKPNSDITFYIPVGINKYKRFSDSVKGKVINKVIDLDIDSGNFTLVDNKNFPWDWYVKGNERKNYEWTRIKSKKEFVKPRYDPNHHCYGEKNLHAVESALNTLMIFHKTCHNDKTGRIMIWIDDNPYTTVKKVILELRKPRKRKVK